MRAHRRLPAVFPLTLQKQQPPQTPPKPTETKPNRNPNRTQPPGIVMGKHSGRNALSTRLKELGFDLGATEVDDVFRRFKALADKKKVGRVGAGGWARELEQLLPSQPPSQLRSS